METKPLVSICIPTYNRAKYLEKSILSIIEQPEFRQGKVEVVVGDNASTDNTGEILEYYALKFPNFSYYKNEENIIDMNFPKVLSLGKGKLRRLCNDTLIFKKGSLNKICDLVNKYEDTRPYIHWQSYSIKNLEREIECDFNKFVNTVTYWVTFSASFSIWDSQCAALESDISGCELHLWQARKSLEIVSKSNNALIVNEKLEKVQAVKNKDVSYGIFKVFYTNLFKLYEPYFDDGILDKTTREKIEKELLFKFLLPKCALWEVNREKNNFSKTENLKLMIEEAYKEKYYWNEYVNNYKKQIVITKVKKIIFIIRNKFVAFSQ